MKSLQQFWSSGPLAKVLALVVGCCGLVSVCAVCVVCGVAISSIITSRTTSNQAFEVTPTRVAINAPIVSGPTLDPSVKLGVEVSVPSMGANHVAVGQPHAGYNSTPPTSGPHFDAPAAWGDSHTTLPEERWIHNLEHGGIVALYNCPQGCPALVQSLDDFLKKGPFSAYGYVKMVVTPYSKIPNKLTLAAWGYYLPLADYDDAAMRRFFADHQDNGPEDVP